MLLEVWISNHPEPPNKKQLYLVVFLLLQHVAAAVPSYRDIPPKDLRANTHESQPVTIPRPPSELPLEMKTYTLQ
jgi:hypothetical protein